MSVKKSVRIMSLVLFLITLISTALPANAASASPPEAKNVDSVCVINTEHNEIVIEKDMNKIIYPTSTVKLMTALVAAEHFADDLEGTIIVTQKMVDSSSARNFEAGEWLSVTDLLHAMLVGGYNDAAVILAYATSGSIEAFCAKMNEKAKAIGAMNTHYTNPTGLHDDAMVTTAYDTALIGWEIMKNDFLLTVTKTVKYTIPLTFKHGERTIYNRNTLITTNLTEEYYYSYAEGMNSGGTDEGGDCVVTAGRLDGLSYVCVVMGGRQTSEDDKANHACAAAKELLRYSLISYEVKTLFSAKETVGTIPVRFSATEESVSVKALRDLSSLLYIGVDLEKEVEIQIEILPELLEAPIKEGEVVGSVKAIYKGEILDSTDLITAKSIDSHGFLVFMYDLKNTTRHPAFIISAAVIVFAVLFFLIRKLVRSKKKDIHKRNRYMDTFDDYDTFDPSE